jgi:putative addiction module killer protein
MNVQEYLSKDGSSPYQEWFDALDIMAAAKVTVAKSRLELGNTSNIKWFDGIGEYRIDWGPGYRIYLLQDGKHLIVLLGGGTKKNQQSDIEYAKRLSQDYKKRKSEASEEKKNAKKNTKKKR